MLEVASQVSHDAETVRLSFQELEQVSKADFSICIQIRLSYQVLANAIYPDLIQYKIVKASSCALID